MTAPVTPVRALAVEASRSTGVPALGVADVEAARARVEAAR